MATYYNENAPKAAAWLRELIAAGLLPAGEVDDRSICDVKPSDLDGYGACHFFAGIGGWPLALRLVGVPDDAPVWTGSCPCQPFSCAGRGAGAADKRHLWPIWFALIEACRPSIIFGEQVASASVIGKAMQGLRRGKNCGLFPASQQGRPAWDVQGLRESSRSQHEAMENREEAHLSSDATHDASGLCSGERRSAASETEGHPVRSGLAGGSSAHRGGLLRGNRAAIRSDYAKGVECPVVGSNRSASWLHEREHASCALRSEHDGERVGRGVDSHHRRGYSEETVFERVERIVATLGRAAGDQLGEVWLDGIRLDLEGAHYTFGASVLAACSVGSSHIRQRLYWVADSEPSRQVGAGIGLPGAGWEEFGFTHSREASASAKGGHGMGKQPDCAEGLEREQVGGLTNTEKLFAWGESFGAPCLDGKTRRIPTEPAFQPLAHGVPARVVRLRGYGNAIVPQLAAEFIRASFETLNA